MNNIIMKHSNIIAQQLKPKNNDTPKQNMLNIINIAKKCQVESPKQRTIYTSLNNLNNNNHIEGEEMKNATPALNSFRPQMLLEQRKKELIKTKGNSNQINIRLNINSEIINNNYHKESNKKSSNKILSNNTNNNPNSKEDFLKEKDKTIQELKKEILNTQKQMNKLRRDNSISNGNCTNIMMNFKDSSTRINSEARSIINMANYNNLLSKTKRSTQLILSEKLFFQNLMKNSKNLKNNLIRKTKFISPKCFSSSSAYLENESRPNSLFETQSIKSGKTHSVKHELKKKPKQGTKESNKIKKMSNMLTMGVNPEQRNIMKNLVLIKERVTKVLEDYDELSIYCLSNKKPHYALLSKALVQNYIK